MAKARATIEDEISDAVKAMPRLPSHQPAEFETPRPPIEYAPPSIREDYAAANAVPVELPPERMKVVEQGLTAFQQTQADRDRMRREIGSLRQKIVELETHLATKQREEHVIEERVRDCLAQRDSATEEAAELRGVLSSLAAILISYFRPENHQHAMPQAAGGKDQPGSLSQT
jgi:hypothetical protein